MEGQKIYFIDIDTRERIMVATGFICPRIDEMVTVFDNETGIYRNYTVINVNHGVTKKTKTMITTVNVKFYNEEK